MISYHTRQKMGESVSKEELAAEAMGGRVTTVRGHKLSKTEQGLIRSNALTQDDNPWRTLVAQGMQGAETLAPTFEPAALALLCQQNNTLMQCVTAMEVNIDGTGWDFETRDGSEKPETDDAELKAVKAFFDEPFPMQSFMQIRRKIRRDLESTGTGYMEVIRGSDGKIACLNHLDSKLTRMVKLDEEPVEVEKEFWRGDQKVKMRMWVRERRFAQRIGTKARYFVEYKASRDVDVKTGAWMPKSRPTPAAPGPQQQKPPEGQEPSQVQKVESQMPQDAPVASTEVIMFTVGPDVSTPYGVPRWINQIPSVLGSRRAEEYNLEFFANGGVPPVMILIQGGQMSDDSRRKLTAYLSGKAQFKQRAVVAEIFATSGDLSGAGNVKVTVERFGSEKQQDSMFEKYDERSHMRVRMSFRLPPLFLGLAQDYNFATAQTAYMVTEAQVFKPERDAFDEVINNTIMRELSQKYRFRSMPLTVKDVETQLKALEQAKEIVSPQEWIDELNELAGLNLTIDEEVVAAKKEREQQEHDANIMSIEAKAKQATQKPPFAKADDGKIIKMSDELLTELANDWAALVGGTQRFEPATTRVMKQMVDALSPQVRKLFNNVVATKLMDSMKVDPDGVEELLSCAGECLHAEA